MKIVAIDFFGRYQIADRLVAENVPKQYAECIAKSLRENFSSQTEPRTFVAVVDDYQLWRGKEPEQ